MADENWHKIRRVFDLALRQKPEDRDNYITDVCRDDQQLLAEVRSLLSSFDNSDDFMEQPAVVAVADMIEPQPRLQTGARLGQYEVVREINSGGMGEVYLATDHRLDRLVAIKILNPRLGEDPSNLQRFIREAKAASALNHPNILVIHEIGEANTTHYIVSEFIEGRTLRETMLTRTLALPEVLDISIQIANALAAAHQANLVHRDIKPENIMIRPDGVVKVLDFGLAKLSSKNSQSIHGAGASTLIQNQTAKGLILGTVNYMSPEQAKGEPVDELTDIFGLGVVIYEMITGRTPFAGNSMSESFANLINAEPQPIRRSEVKVPDELERIVSKTIRKNKDERYQTINRLLADLKKLKEIIALGGKVESLQPGNGNATAALHATGSEADVKIPETQSSVSPSTRRNTSLAILVLIALAIGATVIWFIKFRDHSITSTALVPTVVKTTQLTTWKGLDLYPALARDGKMIAFSSDRSGSFEIYIKQLVPGAREMQITSDGAQNFQSAFSPDGSLIAYHSKKRGGIWVVPLTGGAPKQLTEFGSNPAFSPDGSLVAFQSGEFHMLGYRMMNPRPPSTLWVVSSEGGEPRQLTQAGTPAGGHGGPNWSPDGQRIAFNGSGEGEVVWSISADGKDLKRISGRITGASDALYAPDGRSVYFTADTGWALYKVDLSENGDAVGEPVKFFSAGGQHMRKLAIAADGKNLVYCAMSTMNNIWALPLAPKTKAVTGKPIQLTQNANTCDLGPAISPDGKTIAYWTFATGVPSQVWTMDAAGRNQTQITTNSGSIPWWFPDGRRLAFEAERENHVGLWALNIEGGKETRIIEFNEPAEWSRLSPDGTRVAFVSRRSGTPNIWVTAVEGGTPQQLTYEKELATHPAWSPDGNWIAFEVTRGQNTNVAIIPSSGGQPIQLTSDRGQSLVHDWSPDSEHVVFAGQRDGVWNIWAVARSTKRQTQMTSYTKFSSYVRGPAWSPLGDRIVFEYAENSGNIWTIELK